MKPYKFHPEALEEVDETVFFYEKKQAGLGGRFLKILEETIAKIRNNPLLYVKIEGNIRKSRIARFPYGIIYRDMPGHIEIISVMHSRRRPEYWKNRIKE